MAPATWHGTRSLATERYEAADGDFEIALLLALDYQDKFRGPGPRTETQAGGNRPVPQDAAAREPAPGSLTEREAA